MSLTKKHLLAFIFSRFCVLIMILGCLFAGYFAAFVHHDIMASCSIITMALLGGILFFFDFPAYRIDSRFNQLQNQFFKKAIIDVTIPLGISINTGFRSSIKLKIILIFSVISILFNFVLGWTTYSEYHNSRLFIHMVIIVVSFFIFVSSLLIYKIDSTFKKIEVLISQGINRDSGGVEKVPFI